MVKAEKIELSFGATLFLAGILLLFYGGVQSPVFSLPLIVAGLVLLATVPHGNARYERPLGVRIVGFLVLLDALAFTALGLTVGTLSVMEQMGLGSYATSLAILALAGLCLSIVVLRGVSSKSLWFALMTYWVSILAFSFILDFIVTSYTINIIFYVKFFPTYVYAAICFVYFLTEKPREYFRVKQPISAPNKS